MALVLITPRRLGRLSRTSRAIVLCGVVVLGGAASVTSGAATLKPPVITEPFTPLPCNHGTTLGLEGCAEGQLLSGDRRINEEVRLLFDAMLTSPQKRSFVSVEDEWLTYRKADCTAESSVFQGGTLAPVEYALCEARDDETRSTDLHSYFSLLENGRGDAPKWP